MNINSSDNFLHQAWQLSILANINSTDLNTDLLPFIDWIHIFEFACIILSTLIMNFCHILVVKNSKLKMLHTNMKVFLHHGIGLFYAAQLCRFIVFCSAFSGFFLDVSLFGPLQFFHIARESCLIMGATSYAELALDRYIATIGPEKYEQQKRPYLSIFLLLIVYIYVSTIQTLRYMGLMTMSFMPIMMGVISLITIPILMWIHKKNKQYLSSKHSFSLNKKFQIYENIRICQILIPGAIVLTIGIVIVAFLYLSVYLMNANHCYDASLILTTCFNFAVQLMYVIAPISFTFIIPEMRKLALHYLCGRPLTFQVNQITPMPNQRDVYFSQLQVVWKSRLRSFSYTRMPDGYSEYYARHKLRPLATTLVYHNDTSGINHYLNDCFYNATFYKHVEISCDMFNSTNPKIKCASSLLVSHDDEAIILIFRPSNSGPEVDQQTNFYNVTVPFPGGGTVHKFYWNGFNVLWTAGIREAFFAAKNANPTYELWVTGFSLGGALTGIAAPYASQMGYYNKKDIKVVTFGSPRVGHGDFADRIPSLISYAYHVVHRHDIVPHLMPLTVGYRLDKNEIWYNNDMNEGDPYIECDVGESVNCSDSVPQNLWTWGDHNYFNPSGACIKFTNPPNS